MKRYLMLATLLTLAFGMQAAVTFKASAPQVVEMNEPFRIAYTVNTKDAKNFKAPAISGFNLIAGPYTSQMQSYTNINGQSSAVTSLTYTLTYRATSTGNYSVPSATIEAEGKTLRSNSLQIRVVPASNNASGKNANSGRGNSGRISSPSSFSEISDKDLFITARISKTQVYEQEAFLLTYKLYTLVDVRGFNNVKLPDFEGFHSQEIQFPRSQTLQPEEYNRQTYATAVFRQFVLFPQKSGKLTIPSAQFDVSVAQRTTSMDDLFDAMLNGTASRMVQKTIRTKELTVDVWPLPQEKPEGFVGGVGSLNISSSINSEQAKTGDPLTVKVTISGTGNLQLITAPEVHFPADFEVYDPKVTENFKPTPNGMEGKKVFEYLAIPRNAGEYTIPGVTFSYFNPQTKSYKTQTTQPFKLDIAKGKGSASSNVRDYTEEDVVTDIRYLKKEGDGSFTSGLVFWGSTGFWLAYLLPLALFVALLIIYRKQAIENANVAYAKKKKANKAAIRRLKTAAKLLRQKEYDAFYDEVIRALWGYVSDKLTIPTSELTKENVSQKLSAKGVGEENTSLFIRTLSDCEFAKYAPGDKNEAMDQTYAAALRIITQLDNEIKR